MEMDLHVPTAVATAARHALEQLAGRVGVTGREAMRTTPGLTAAVDQHVAQIRHTLARLRPESLAAYADGVIDAVTAKGWTFDGTAAGWHRASWPSVHLLAVCVLAEAVQQ